MIQCMQIDFPAAHSMDTAWFAVDDAGEIACMKSGEGAPLPKDAIEELNLYSLFAYLDRDECGIPVFPAVGKVFPDGESIDGLNAFFAALPPGIQDRIRQLAAQARVSEEERRALDESLDACRTEFVNDEFLIRFVAPDDALDLRVEWQTVVRLDAAQPIYHVVLGSLGDVLRLLVKGRVRAWRVLETDDEDVLSDLYGIYFFQGEEEALVTRDSLEFDCLPFLDAEYGKSRAPSRPRIGLPGTAMSRMVEAQSVYGGERPVSLVHRLAGIRFSAVDTLQIADYLPCYGFTGEHSSPAAGDIRVRRNLAIIVDAERTERAERARHVAQWLQAAQGGDLLAQFSLGCLQRLGEKRDYARAAEWFRKAAEQAEGMPLSSANTYENGSAAQCALADACERGLGVGRDYDQALLWYARAAIKGNDAARKRLMAFWQDERDYDGTPMQARARLSKLAQAGYPAAMQVLDDLENGAYDSEDE